MRRAEILWARILGVLVLLLGLTLLVSPEVTYTTREKIGRTDYSVKRQKTIVIPRTIAVLIIGAGIVVLVAMRRKPEA